MTIAHLLLMIYPTCPEGDCNPGFLAIPGVMLAIFYAFYSVIIWPCVQLVCHPSISGTGVGIMACV